MMAVDTGVMAGTARGADAFPPVRVAVVGLGYWGPNLVRNLQEHPAADLVIRQAGGAGELLHTQPARPLYVPWRHEWHPLRRGAWPVTLRPPWAPPGATFGVCNAGGCGLR